MVDKKEVLCMKKIIRAASIILSAAIFFSISACTERENGDAAGEEDGQVIKIGGIGPLTGSSAIYGQSTKNGAQIAVEEINERGGIKFALRYEDDENDTEKAVNAYNKLKDWGMKISLGTVTTQPCIAVSAELNEDWIFAITPSASSTDVIGGQPDADGNMATRRKDNMFQMCFTDPNQGIASAQYIKERGLGERIAVIYNNSDAYSTGI